MSRNQTNMAIINTTMADSSTWYKIDFESTCGANGCCIYNVGCRAANPMKLSAIASGTTYKTIPSGQTYFEDQLRHIKSIYVQGTNDGDVCEVICYW